MRVTNAMLSNNMILGLNKNMNKLNTLYDQMNSLKKIQRPSDDPIILGRSLKLRLNVLETEQYKINVGEAKSWMEISEGSIKNSHAILNDIRQESAQAANGTLDFKDRQKIMTTVEQLKKQLVQESNANYAGRNVFAGYKTDQKVLFDKDEMDKSGAFEHQFTKGDLAANDYKGIVNHREEEYYRIRAPYGDIENGKLEIGDPLVNIPITAVNSDEQPPQGPPIESFYHPEPGKAYFLKDTGEFIVNKADYDKMDSGFKISYEKKGFKSGEPNPEVFFDTKKATPPATGEVYTKSKPTQNLEYEIGIGTKMDINALGKDLFSPFMLRDIDELVHVLGVFENVEDGINNKDPDINDGKATRSHKETINISKLFSNAIGKMDNALKSVSRQQADLGSRMKRLELTEKRLGDDEISYSELLSKTEDVELERAYIDFYTQFAVYQSALQVTAKVVQPTLMEFLR